MAPPSKRKYSETGYRGGWTLPGYPHCGPFNDVSDKPSSGLDEVCRQHDLEYGKLGSAAYFKYNDADAKFREQAAHISGPAARLTSGIWAVKQRITPHLSASTDKEMPKRAGSSGRYNKLAKEAGISDQQRHAAYARINAAKRRRLEQQQQEEQVSDDEWEDAVGPMEADGGMIVTDGPGGGAIAGSLGGNSSTTVTAPGFLMPMPLRRGFMTKRYHKRGVMIFCNGGLDVGEPPIATATGEICQLFSWLPWHSKQLDSSNWFNDIADKIELGPVLSCVQGRCFKPLSFVDEVIPNINNFELGRMFDDSSARAARKVADINRQHCHDLARLSNFVCKLWPPDSFDQVTEAAGQTQPKLELMMAWDADYFPSHTKSHWDIGQVVRGMSEMQDGDPRYMPLRWNSSVKCLRLGEDGLEIPIKWKQKLK